MSEKQKKKRQNSGNDPGKFPGIFGTMGGRQLASCLKIPLFLVVFSVGAIFAYDFVTQSPLFMIRQITVSGNDRVSREEVLEMCGLNKVENILRINVTAIEKRLCAHPWIESASLHRDVFSMALKVGVTEQEPLAIANIENIVRVVINTQGIPFKEYDPETDHLGGLPVISGLDLTLSGSSCKFQGPLFDSIMEFFQNNPDAARQVITVNGDSQTGISIYTRGIFEDKSQLPGHMIPIKMGFDRFREKLAKARDISAYIAKNFPDKTIRAIDLFDVEKVFVKVQDLHGDVHGLGKGV